MKIDKRLNLVLAVEQDQGAPLYIHSTPIKRDFYDANHRLITRVAVSLFEDNFGPATAIRVAALTLRDVAKTMDADSRTPNSSTYQTAADNLINEINRLTNVAVPSGNGWENMPLHNALAQKLFDEDSAAEVRNAIVFFTVASWFYRAAERENTYEILRSYGARIESSDFTAFVSSLPTSTLPASSGEKATPSSIAH